MQHYLIIADGEFLSTDLILQATQNHIIIALDGAADRLAAIRIQPNIILGDFDTINPGPWGIQKTFSEMTDSDQPYLNSDNILIIPAKNQQYTDLQKAIHYCDQHQAASITIICAMGGRLDHQEGNLRNLRLAYRADRPIHLHTETETIHFAKDETLTFKGNPGDKCAIMAFPGGFFTSLGLTYEGQRFPLIFSQSESTCNSFKAPNVTIMVEGEALLIMPNQLKT